MDFPELTAEFFLKPEKAIFSKRITPFPAVDKKYRRTHLSLSRPARLTLPFLLSAYAGLRKRSSFAGAAGPAFPALCRNDFFLPPGNAAHSYKKAGNPVPGINNTMNIPAENSCFSPDYKNTGDLCSQKFPVLLSDAGRGT